MKNARRSRACRKITVINSEERSVQVEKALALFHDAWNQNRKIAQRRRFFK
jgi:hypothetical protein